MFVAPIAHSAGPNVDAGTLLRQTEQEFTAKKFPPQREHLQAKSQSLGPSDEMQIEVRSFKFTGNLLISNEVLHSALLPFSNRSLTLRQIKEAADAVSAAYLEAGWTARASLPQQEIVDGVVTIEITEAVFGVATLEGVQPKRIEASYLVKMAQARLTKGKPLHANDLDRVLLLLDDLPGVSVAGHLVAGAHDGETNLMLSAMDDTWANGNATLDNQGSRATGIERLSANFNVNSPARVGDLLTTNLLRTQGTRYARGGYSLPIGDDGWRAGVHASQLQYALLTSYDANVSGTRGNASTAGLDVSYPLLRSQLNNVNWVWSYDDKKFENFVADALNSTYRIKASSMALNGSRIDGWGGGGYSSAGITWTNGRLLNEGSPNAQSDLDGARVAGHYSKLNLNFSRLQSLNADLSFFTAINSQVASKNLDSSERMYLGGVSGVRAFPSSEAGGAAGRTVTMELRQRLDSGWTLTGFYDHGHINVNKNNANASNGTAISALNSYSLQGYGASLTWLAPGGMELKATLAKRSAANPTADVTTGQDGDKTKFTTRAWVSAGMAF